MHDFSFFLFPETSFQDAAQLYDVAVLKFRKLRDVRDDKRDDVDAVIIMQA